MMHNYDILTKTIDVMEVITKLPVTLFITGMTDKHVFMPDSLTDSPKGFRGLLSSDVDIDTHDGSVTINGKFDEEKTKDDWRGVHFGGVFYIPQNEDKA